MNESVSVLRMHKSQFDREPEVFGGKEGEFLSREWFESRITKSNVLFF